MGRTVAFEVYGEAKAESKRTGRARAGKDGSIIQGRRYEPADRKDWKAMVRDSAVRAMDGQPPLEGPLIVNMVFMRPKPPSWPKKSCKGNLWPWSWWKKPDLNNLVKPAEDAMSTVVWLDDAQIVSSYIDKVNSDRFRVVVWVREASEEHCQRREAVGWGVAEKCAEQAARAAAKAQEQDGQQ